MTCELTRIWEELPCSCYSIQDYQFVGKCSNMFHTARFNEIDNAARYGVRWGDLNLLWEERDLAALSTEELIHLEEMARFQKEKEVAERALEAEANLIAEKARNREITAHYKCNKDKKIMQPCIYLYSCEGKGRDRRATTLHISSECWTHEYHDPKTGELIAKHACWHLHPEEEGWCEEWNKNRLFKPQQSRFEQPQQSRFPQQQGRFPQRPAYNAQLESDGFAVAGAKKPRQRSGW
jgi:hypothetical protein